MIFTSILITVVFISLEILQAQLPIVLACPILALVAMVIGEVKRSWKVGQVLAVVLLSILAGILYSINWGHLALIVCVVYIAMHFSKRYLDIGHWRNVAGLALMTVLFQFTWTWQFTLVQLIVRLVLTILLFEILNYAYRSFRSQKHEKGYKL